jgi:phytoene/squalene synthetase
MDLREIGWDDMDWIDLAQDRGQWRALVNTVMNRAAAQLAASQEGLSSMSECVSIPVTGHEGP